MCPLAYAHWVAPGACYNRIGYYEVPNARVVYRDGRSVRSFGIASMISWRGVWYVVHLGAVSGDASGTVDAPSAGAGRLGAVADLLVAPPKLVSRVTRASSPWRCVRSSPR